MRNRAKCKLCESIIESFHSTDYVSCKCDEISVSCGEALYCAAKDWNNFIRVDDIGNAIVPTIKDTSSTLSLQTEYAERPTKKQLLDILHDMITNMENLPQNALTGYINHYDLLSVLLLVESLFLVDCKAEICDIKE
jgi:HKD family nuclease